MHINFKKPPRNVIHSTNKLQSDTIHGHNSCIEARG
uniref:Uncharacterized protein n=1 Tax=Anguilla anguilla TaxID=7936 RepID=A0A0E9WSX6_ANGAN